MIQAIALLSPILPLLTFLLFCTKERSAPLSIIFIYLVASFGIDLISTITSWGRAHTMFLWNLFAFLEFGIVMTFYYLILRPFKNKLPVIFVIVGYVIIAFVFSNKSSEEFNSIMNSANAVIFVVSSIGYFIKQFSTVDFDRPVPLPIFWIVAGIMLSFSSTFFLYLISSHLSEAQKDKYWTLNAVSNILTNVIFSIAFILNKFQKKVPAPESHTPDYDGFPN